MKYIICCGGDYTQWETPRHLTEINGETIVGRTIRLLRESGIDDISISTNNEAFEQFGLPILRHNNEYTTKGYNDCVGQWCNVFYPTDEPTCYIFGDVIFSPEAIRTIVNTETDDILLFGSKRPFSKQYPKKYIEPFAYKVVDTDHLKRACNEVKRLDKEGVFARKPIAWELWSVICGTDPNIINKSYQAINDYTCDIDYPSEVDSVKDFVK